MVSARLRKVLKAGRYQYVFVLLPTSDTHGHHQAAALLTTSEVMRLPEAERPVVLGAYPAAETHSSVTFQEEEARYSVDRRKPVTPDSPLTYSVVVNWVIAAHKSQGLFQNETGKDTAEQFWILDTGTPIVQTSRDACLLNSSSSSPRKMSKAMLNMRLPDSPQRPEHKHATGPTRSAFALYFLRLGTLGFGGPIALAGAMQRDLVDERQWIALDEYQEGLALAQLMPGPLAAQLAIYLGWVRFGVRAQL